MKKYLWIGIVSVLLIVIATVIFIINQDNKIVQEIDDLFLNGQYDAVIDDTTERLSSKSNELDNLLILAATYAQKGSVSFREEEYAQKAIEYADKALLLDPNNSEAYRIKGYAYEIQEKYSLAHENYDQAIILNPKNALVMSNKGHAYDLEGQIDKAQELYQTSLALNPHNGHALINLARVFVRKEKFEQATFTLNNLFTSNPQVRFKAEGYMTLSYIQYLEEEFELALESINKAIQIDETLPQAYVQRARLILGSALDAESESELQTIITNVTRDLESALDINPNQTSAYVLFMEMQFITGNSAVQKEYQSKALQAVELDITLGRQEKEDVRRYLNAKVKVIN